MGPVVQGVGCSGRFDVPPRPPFREETPTPQVLGALFTAVLQLNVSPGSSLGLVPFLGVAHIQPRANAGFTGLLPQFGTR